MTESSADWNQVGAVEPKELCDSRLQLHWAVQPVMAFADCALDRLPDDSQSNLGWRDDIEAMVGRSRPDGLAAGLRVAEMALLVFDEGGAIVEGLALEGRTIDQAISWLDVVVTNLTGKMPAQPISIRDYEMPEHPVATGSVFAPDRPPALAELARWFANGNLVLQGLASTDEGWAEVRCWPHHFDLGTLISLESSSNALTGRSIGAGMSTGDTWYPEPYFFVNPYGLADLPADGGPLESGGHWHTEGWFGAVLTAESILAIPQDSRESAASDFLRGAVDAAQGLLSS